VEVYLPLYKSYISGSCDHLSATEISRSCGRKWNGERVEEGWKLKDKRGALCWGELWHTTTLTSKFKYSLQYIHNFQVYI
jgi:hypothetical protein